MNPVTFTTTEAMRDIEFYNNLFFIFAEATVILIVILILAFIAEKIWKSSQK